MSANEIGSTALRKGNSFIDLSAGIVQMYQNPAENVTANIITSEKQAIKEIKEIVSRFKESTEWSDKMTLCQQLMADIKGGACNFPLFVQDIPTLVPMLSHCVQNLRSTLVKFGCLCIVQIAQTLQERFDSTASTFLGFLFPPTTHATAIIACSCKCAIEAIVKNCPGKFVLNGILSNVSSKSQEHRNIVAEALFEIVSSWPRTLVSQYIKQIEQGLTALVNDAGLDSRNTAKAAFDVLLSKNMIKAIPESVLSSQKTKQTEVRRQMTQPTRQKLSASPQKKVKKTGFEEESKTMTFNLRTNSSIFETYSKLNSSDTIKTSEMSVPVIKEKSKEQEIISNVRRYKTNPQSLKENASYIAEGLMSCLDSIKEDDISSALRLIDDTIGVLCSSFQIYIDRLIDRILKFANSSTFLIAQNARHLLTSIPSYFDGEMLLRYAFLIEPSNQMLVFFQSIIRKDQSVLKSQEICNNLLIICCAINDKITEARYKAITLTIIENIKRTNNDAFVEFAETGDENQIAVLKKLSVFPSGMATPRMETQTRLSFSLRNESTKAIPASPEKTQQHKPVTIQTTTFLPPPERSSLRRSAFEENAERTVTTKTTTIIADDDISIHRVDTQKFTQIQTKSVSLAKRVELPDILKKINRSNDKIEYIQELKNYFAQQKDFSKDSLDLLVNLLHSEYYLEAESCIDELVASVEKEPLVSEAISTFLFNPSSASMNFLSLVLRKVGVYRYTPKVKNAMIQLRDYTSDSDPEMRKSAIKCIVEFKAVVGEQVDADISLLDATQNILIQHYLEKRSAQ